MAVYAGPLWCLAFWGHAIYVCCIRRSLLPALLSQNSVTIIHGFVPAPSTVQTQSSTTFVAGGFFSFGNIPQLLYYKSPRESSSSPITLVHSKKVPQEEGQGAYTRVILECRVGGRKAMRCWSKAEDHENYKREESWGRRKQLHTKDGIYLVI